MSADREGRALEAVLKLTALDERSAELKASLERIERKLEILVERLARVEAKCERLERTRGESSEPTVRDAPLEDEPLARSFLTIASEE